MNIQFSLDGFKYAVNQGLFLPCSLTYGYVDEAKFEDYQKKQGWEINRIADTFVKLQERMSRRYYKNMVLAQTSALDYSALQFPAYSSLITEDLSEDWLAIVDFHKKYPSRDHSLHQPLTAYIAATLLGFGEAKDSLAIPIAPSNLLDYCVDVIFTKEAEYIREAACRHGFPDYLLEKSDLSHEFWKDLFYRTVMLSALFHDIGYPWQYVDKIDVALRNNAGILHSAETSAMSIINKFNDRMVFLPLRHYRSSHVNEPLYERDELCEITKEALKTHGFPGAIAFLSLNDAIRRYPLDQSAAILHEFSVEWAAMGIFMHDMQGKHKEKYQKLRVHINQDPLSAIISLSDYLEEFNRPKVSFFPKSKQSRMKYYSDCSFVELDSDSHGTLTIKMRYSSGSSKAIAAVVKYKETEDYFDSGNGYVDLTPMGIKRVIYEQL